MTLLQPSFAVNLPWDCPSEDGGTAGGVPSSRRRGTTGLRPRVRGPEERVEEAPLTGSLLQMLDNAAGALDRAACRFEEDRTGLDETCRTQADDLAAALRAVDLWKARARMSDGRIESLEQRLAVAEKFNASLRARFGQACGKLADPSRAIRRQTLADVLLDPAAGGASRTTMFVRRETAA